MGSNRLTAGAPTCGRGKRARKPSVQEHIIRIAVFVKLGTRFVITFVVLVGVWAVFLPAASAENPTAFINTIGSQGLEVIRSSTTLDQKAGYFHQVLRQDFDLPGLSRFVLGPYWRVASEAQRQEFPT